MRKFTPYFDFFFFDFMDSVPVSQGKSYTRKTYRDDFWPTDYELIPVELDLIDVWPEEKNQQIP